MWGAETKLIVLLQKQNNHTKVSGLGNGNCEWLYIPVLLPVASRNYTVYNSVVASCPTFFFTLLSFLKRCSKYFTFKSFSQLKCNPDSQLCRYRLLLRRHFFKTQPKSAIQTETDYHKQVCKLVMSSRAFTSFSFICQVTYFVCSLHFTFFRKIFSVSLVPTLVKMFLVYCLRIFGHITIFNMSLQFII